MLRIAMAYVTKVMALTRKMCAFTFHGGQFIGLLGSSGPSQSTMLGSTGSSDFSCSLLLIDTEEVRGTLASSAPGSAVSSSAPSLGTPTFVLPLDSLFACCSLLSCDFRGGDDDSLSVGAVASSRLVTGALKDFGSSMCSG